MHILHSKLPLVMVLHFSLVPLCSVSSCHDVSVCKWQQTEMPSLHSVRR